MNESVEYVNTLRCREFKIHDKTLLKILDLPDENIVDIYREGAYLHIVTDVTIIEEGVKEACVSDITILKNVLS